jgi:hypothetical protein
VIVADRKSTRMFVDVEVQMAPYVHGFLPLTLRSAEEGRIAA